jgi:hypothetical protein
MCVCVCVCAFALLSPRFPPAPPPTFGEGKAGEGRNPHHLSPRRLLSQASAPLSSSPTACLEQADDGGRDVVIVSQVGEG